MNPQTLSAILFSSLLAAVLGYNWNSFELECVDELNVDKSTVEELNNPLRKDVPEDDADLNAFLECSWRKQGTLGEDGKIDWKKVAEILRGLAGPITGDEPEPIQAIKRETTEFLKGAMVECREQNIQGDSPGQVVARVQNCMGRIIRKKWIQNDPLRA